MILEEWYGERGDKGVWLIGCKRYIEEQLIGTGNSEGSYDLMMNSELWLFVSVQWLLVSCLTSVCRSVRSGVSKFLQVGTRYYATETIVPKELQFSTAALLQQPTVSHRSPH